MSRSACPLLSSAADMPSYEAWSAQCQEETHAPQQTNEDGRRPRLCVVYPDAKTRSNAQKSLILAPNVNRLDTTFEKWPVSTAAQFWTEDCMQGDAIATGKFTSKLPN